jgi:uncharacterized GH25 family protein
MKKQWFRSPVMVLISLFLLAPMAAPVLAHDMWIDVRDYTPAPGEVVTMTLAYGHYLPAREFLPKEYLDEIYLLDPNGNRLEIQGCSDVEFKTQKVLAQEGTYLVVATQKGRFWTKTTDGYQPGKSKKGLKNVIGCTYSAKFSKAIVNVGARPGDLLAKPLGHELEIVPLADPGTLRSGDMLPVKVLFRNKPLSGAQVLATYVGFSREKNTFAYATKTDAAGTAGIRVATAGAWLVAVHHKDDYPDPAECDQYSFAATLTFETQ